MVQINADQVLAMMKEEFPKEYLLCVQKVALLEQEEQIKALKEQLRQLSS
jgi:aspartyl/asparaginyl beta-hydroxylase (cupin superfamily)